MQQHMNKRRAVFLDRDGVINEEVDYLRSIDQLRVLPRAAEGIHLFNELNLPVIVVTNQPVIARGWLSHDELDEIHDELVKQLLLDDARVDAIYYCPHHPEADLEEYRIKCECRKPGTALFEFAAREHDIDLLKSFMIGDSTRDILAGKNAGMATIAVSTGYGGEDDIHDIEPDYRAADLFAAAERVRELIQS